MADKYQAVGWNGFKLRYDLWIGGAVAAFVIAYSVAAVLSPPTGDSFHPVQIAMRASGAAAFALLTAVLAIGPLARFVPGVAPLLYNRRHAGVMVGLIALVHAALAIGWYYSFSPLNPFVALLASRAPSLAVTAVPFELLGLSGLAILLVMAATSHDHWLKVLGAPRWKALHMAVYGAYALLVGHVAFGMLQVERAAGDLLAGGNRLAHRRLGAATDVEDGALRAALHRRDRGGDRIADVGEAARCRPVAEQLEGRSLGERRQDAREGHVGPLARAVHGEVAQADRIEAEGQLAGAGEVLAAELGDAVGRDRAGRRVLARRVALGLAVDRRRGGEDDAHPRGACRLEEALAGEQVAPQIDREGSAEAAHAGLARQVEDAVDPLEQRRQVGLGEVGAHDRAAGGVLLLQGRVVVVGEAVERDRLVALRLQRLTEVRADEARCACYEIPAHPRGTIA